jgi:hypothetical protein
MSWTRGRRASLALSMGLPSASTDGHTRSTGGLPDAVVEAVVTDWSASPVGEQPLAREVELVEDSPGTLMVRTDRFVFGGPIS